MLDGCGQYYKTKSLVNKTWQYDTRMIFIEENVNFTLTYIHVKKQ